MRKNLSTDYLMLRTQNQKGYTILSQVNIDVFNHNVVIKSLLNTTLFSNLMIKYHLTENNSNKVEEAIHLASDNFLIVMNEPAIERLEVDTGLMIMNIIADKIDYFEQPILYIRKTKIEKIREEINGRKKGRASSNQRG